MRGNSITTKVQRFALLAGLLLVAACGGGGGGSGSGGGGAASSSSSSSSVTPVVLPILAITTDGGAAIVDKDNYVGSTITLPAIGATAAYSGHAGVKLHGNSTLMHPKKPYRIKLDSKSGLAGMPSDKNWVLLANYSDKTLLRNRTAMEVSRRLGLPWTPKSIQVEVTLNGVYQGAYDLIEQVRVATNRINITETDNVTPAVASDGGYLFEMNERMDDPVCWRTTKGVAICLKTPDPSRVDQQTYIKGVIQAAEDSLWSADPTNATTGYESYFKVDTLIDWYLVNELFKNVDSNGYNSVYVYKDKNGKLIYGPAWDFDLGAGNTDYFDASPNGFQTATGVWIARMKAVDPTFRARIRARWNAIKATQIDTIPAYIDEQAALLATAQAANFVKWPILNTYVWPNSEVAGSYQGEVNFFRNWMIQRITWMDANL